MAGVDKAFIELQGKPLIQWVIDSVSDQVGQLYINTSRQDKKYKALGYPLIPDIIGPDIGPLAGILTGLESAPSKYLLISPCDTPLLPVNVCAVLYQHLCKSDAKAATVHDGNKLHPVILLVDCALVENLSAYIDAGYRSVAGWLEVIGALQVDFSDQRNAFHNVNTPDDLSKFDVSMSLSL